MVSVVQASAVQENVEPDRTNSTSVIVNLDNVNTSSKISFTESPRKAKKPLCRFLASKQICPYGARCRYWHPPTQPPKPTCRHYLQGQCRYGNRCKFRHPEEVTVHHSDGDNSSDDDSSNVLNVTDFPSIVQSKDLKRNVHNTQRPPPPLVHKKPDHPPPPKEHETRRVLHHHDGSQTVPVELQLEAFFKRASTITPKPPVTRPGKKTQEKPMGVIVNKVMQIEEAERKYLKEGQLAQDDSRERDIHVLPFTPSDPEWDRYGNQTIQIIVTFPENYPEQPLSLKVIDEGTLPKTVVLAINTRLDKQVALMHEDAAVMSGHAPVFKNLLNWLDKNIIDISDKNREECVSDDEESMGSSDGSTGSSDEEEWEGDQGEDSGELLRPSKRGTEIRLVDFSLNRNVATLQLTRLKLTVQCTRCKNKEDVVCNPEKQLSVACDKCHSCFGVNLHPDIVHPANSSLCFMDIMGCRPVDVVLPSCDFTVACLECQKESTISGLSYGEPLQTSCHRCHSRLQVFTENCKFVVHHSGPLDEMTSGIAAAKKKKRSKDGFIIQEGRPLPELGTCLHYKKSHRWLRFPCCGKAYPCDVCHDTSEDHPMERANRMICGYCSKEQGYTGIKPCLGCGSDLAHTKGSAYWEGGKGCRNKIKMKRTDPHKYKHDNKVMSKKDERVGIKGKNNRTKNHPSV